jgi:hypothetical protein
VKVHNDIGFAMREMEGAANLYAAAAFTPLQKMSQSFLESYVSRNTGQASLPKDTGNLIDSTSIVIATGDSSDRTIHLRKMAIVPQKWGNWGNIEKGRGWGVRYRMDDIDDTMSIEKGREMAVSLRVAIPYAVPLNEEGSHGKHRGFFDWFSDDYKYNVLKISREVASLLNDRSGDALIFEGKTRL